MNTTGVLLLNLGGPGQLADVQPFLYNLFSDRNIIRLGPPFMQKPLARFIAWRRAPKSRESYRLIGGASPLARITAEQAAALADKLAAHGFYRVAVAMRYWRPDADTVLAGLDREGVRRLVALPLYPHYSVATTGSSLVDLDRAAAGFSPGFEIASIQSWQQQPRYIGELAQTIIDGLARFGADEPRVVYSAHSLPRKFVDEGDPYVDHLQATIRAVEQLTGRPGILCYQSRSGPVEWLAPSTPETLDRLAAEGCKNILMVPISFVSDHVETLYEIDMLYRQQAAGLGIRLERTDSLNVRPGFIDALQELVLEAVAAQGW